MSPAFLICEMYYWNFVVLMRRLAQLLATGLERLAQLMNPQGCETLLHEVAYLARLAVDDILETPVRTCLSNYVGEMLPMFGKFSEKTRIDGLRALKMIATACSATISVVRQCEGSSTLELKACQLLSNESEVEGNRRSGGFVELWEDAYALFFFHKIAQNNLNVKQYAASEYGEWSALNEELSSRREELTEGMNHLF